MTVDGSCCGCSSAVVITVVVVLVVVVVVSAFALLPFSFFHLHPFFPLFELTSWSMLPMV